MKYVTTYSSKYNSKEFNKFIFILNKLKEKHKFEKEEFITIIKLIYNLNPDEKDKNRKRTLENVISIVEEKNSNFIS